MQVRYLFLEKDWNRLTTEFEKLDIKTKKLLMEKRVPSATPNEDGSTDFQEEPPELRVSLSRLDVLRGLLRNSEVISDTSHTTAFVRIGSSVTIRVDGGTEETWTVGSYRVLDKKSENEIPYMAPRINPLLGLQVGDTSDIVIPGRGALEVEVIAIT